VLVPFLPQEYPSSTQRLQIITNSEPFLFAFRKFSASKQLSGINAVFFLHGGAAHA